ncbi:MAG: type II toxin-antitoxin system PemK/MazF family toxin [Bacteroidota bacterium]|nr:type II toxin-antitoxin system PemK/MazF family toxin [Bacteroidota bacterium]
MIQGDIYEAYLNPTKGNELDGMRPVVIISGESMNNYTNLRIICPLTSKVKKYPGGVILKPTTENGLTETSEILVSQIRTISTAIFIKKIGTIQSTEIKEILEGLNDILTL